MSASSEPQCRVIATREPESPLWTFFLLNDGEASIDSAELDSVRYEWGEQYMGGESPHAKVTGLPPGERAVIWQDDGSSEMRTDLWPRVTSLDADSWFLFEFPKLYRQQGTELVALPTRVSGPPR